MPAIKLSVPHKLGVPEAKRRITSLLSETKSKFGNLVTDVRESWAADTGHFSFAAMGFPISGTLEVLPAVVNVEINLPFAALPLKTKIENELTSQARALLT